MRIITSNKSFKSFRVSPVYLIPYDTRFNMGDVAGVDYVLHQAAWGCAPCKALDKDIEPVFGPDRAGDYGGYWVVSIRHRDGYYAIF